MPVQTVQFVAWNRGRVSPLALARVDVERIALSAETYVNFVPRVLGSMMLRSGWEYIGSSKDEAQARYLSFVFATNDVALLELTDSVLRVWIDDELVTRVAVTAVVTNGTFDTDLTGWTDNDESGGTSVWVTGGYMGLTGNGTNGAIRDQQVTVTETGTEHALRVVIERGPVIISIGSTAGGGEYLDQAVLETGTHSLAFTPTGDFHIRFFNRLKRQVLVDSVTVESAGVMEVTTPWLASDLDSVRIDQSGDIVYVTVKDYQQRQIQRRGARSWGVARYAPEDGPFRPENTGPITITSSALSGNITLTASKSLFRSGHVGALWRVTSTGQIVEADVTAENQFTNTIRITGVTTSRAFQITRAGTWTATVTLQRSFTSSTGPFEDVETYTTNGTKSFNDGFDNLVVWYRIGVKTGDFTSGTVELTLDYPTGSVDGVVRITGFTSVTVVDAEVITDFGGTDATDVWTEGEWSDFRGWPTAVLLHQGRLWFAGKDGVWGSVSDLYESFDEDVKGDSRPILRTIGKGPVDTINWMLGIQKLLLGTEGAELSCRSNTLDEPLTPSNFSINAGSTQGSANVEAIKLDNSGLFVQRGGTRVFRFVFNGERLDYDSVDLTLFVPEIGDSGVKRIASQRQPDTRVHCVKNDGTVAMLVLNELENVLCWFNVETDGDVEDVVVLPGATGSSEDQVYYLVKRTIDGSDVRYLEKWALESECQGGTLNKQADSFVTGSGTTITGLDHLEGEEVIAWGDGKDLGTFTVASGQIVLPSSATSVVVGLGYQSRFKSAKLAYAASRGSALTQKKRLPHLGVILSNTHYQGLRYGPSFDVMDELPQIKDGAPVAADTVYSVYDEEAFEFPGEWDTDSRLCLEANAPRPCTLLAAIIPMETKEKS